MAQRGATGERVAVLDQLLGRVERRHHWAGLPGTGLEVVDVDDGLPAARLPDPAHDRPANVVRVLAGEREGSNARRLDLRSQGEELVERRRRGPAVLVEQGLVVPDAEDRIR